MTTLQKPDGSKTTSIKDTMDYILDYLIPEDREDEDTDHHKHIRTTTEEPDHIVDDREFSQDEIMQIIENFDRKSPLAYTV